MIWALVWFVGLWFWCVSLVGEFACFDVVCLLCGLLWVRRCTLVGLVCYWVCSLGWFLGVRLRSCVVVLIVLIFCRLDYVSVVFGYVFV